MSMKKLKISIAAANAIHRVSEQNRTIEVLKELAESFGGKMADPNNIPEGEFFGSVMIDPNSITEEKLQGLERYLQKQRKNK